MHNDDTNQNEDIRDEELRDEPAQTEAGSPGEPASDEPVDQTSESGEPKSGEQASEASEASATEPHGIVGIRFEACGKVYCFKSNGLGLKRGERVVVESDLGVSIGRVVVEDEVPQDPSKQLKPVLRRVSEDDLKQEEDNKSLKKEAFDFCNERIMARGLSMKLLGTDVTLDKKRIVFFFSAETRIDFRELVKDLAAKFRTRIELRQVGVRDAARITGGLGVCGRELCCRRFLTSFLPISIKMAKKQELALNTSKLSGICGRLMCCLGYEYDEKLKELQRERREQEHVREPEETPKEYIPKPTPKEREPVKEPEPARQVSEAPEAQEGESPSRRKRRRRRRRSGRGNGEGDRQQAQEQRSAQAPASAQKPAETSAQGEKPSGDKPTDGASSVKKPFRRKRRRRMKGKKKE